MIHTRHEYIKIITDEILDCMSQYEEYCERMRDCETYLDEGETRKSLDNEWWNITQEHINSLLKEFRDYCFMSDKEYSDFTEAIHGVRPPDISQSNTH